MKQYTKKIEPEKFEDVPELIDQRFDSNLPDEIVRLAVIQKMVHDGVSYHHSGHGPVSPSKMLDKLSGDCEDHSALLASLYKAAGFNVTVVRVKTGSGYHVLPEVENPLPAIEETCDHLRKFYWKNFNLYPENISYEEYDSRYWFPVDTAGDEKAGWCRYVGDISSYIPDTVREKSGGEWEWKKSGGRIEV